MDQSRLDELKRQKEEIEALEEQIVELVPLVQDLWKTYIGTGDDVPSGYVIAVWIAKGDLHAIRDAIIAVAVEGDRDDPHSGFEELLTDVESRITPGVYGDQ